MNSYIHCILIFCYRACYSGKTEVVKQLVAKSGSQSLYKENIFSETPLHW